MSLKIAILEIDIIWEDIESNFEKVNGYLKTIDKDVDLVILPEMFLSAFSMNVSDIALEMNSLFIEQIRHLAGIYDFAVLGTLAVKENGNYYNRALFFHPDGKIEVYDKRHLFSIGKETDFYTRGEASIIIDYRGFRIMPLICYDLRFPVWSRNRNGYDILIYMANWPKSRQNVWDILLKARAIENSSYVVGVNRIGEGGGISYNGGSVVIDFKGNVLCNIKPNDIVKYCRLDMSPLKTFRWKFPVDRDADDFVIQ